MATTAPKIDPRVKRTRELLVQAFFALLGERGFRAITVQDIAERATVNRATFYAHFEDKFALMDSIVRERFKALLAQTLSAGAAFTRANLQLLVRAVCDQLAEMRDIECRPADHEQFEPLAETAIQEELHTFLAAWLRRLPAATRPPSASAATVATTMSWAIFGAGLRWSRGGRELTAEAQARQVVSVLMEGMPQALGVAEQIG